MHHVSDFIIRVKNGYHARLKEVYMPYAKITKAIAQVLVKEGYLSAVKETEHEGSKQLQISLRYHNRKPVFHEVAIVSKPSLRIYVDAKKIASEKDRTATAIVSTSSGIMTGREAVKKGVGGELLFKIW